MGQTGNVQRGQLGLDQRAGVVRNSSVIWVWLAFIQLSGTFFSRFATSLMGVQLGGALVRAVGDALQGNHLAGDTLKGALAAAPPPDRPR